MRIYHGAKQIVREPRFGIGRSYNDFGLGFYCTENEERASEWAVSASANGFVSVYAFNDTGLRVIDLASSQYTILHWLNLLMNYRVFDSTSASLHQAREYIMRNYSVDYQSCDCISGYRADDVSFALAQMFLNNELSLQELQKNLRSGDLGKQFVLKSNRAFDRISYVGYTAVSSRDIYPEKASREMSVLVKAHKSIGAPGLYISDLIREEVKAYDARLQ